ncbi:uncharacterized protein Z520_08385 [Fonsecaea multimorphosa CBS 102226]|uniref:Uncharacterized protein n=1 Tax=Fonsecaea multimorphosa CBS 102226 TaxID=1442371 RepID=A0A0D2H2N1_9EURO|nr:uncharacterized protein Z520_08385 [Fonsecaea multimorphosa CBS 102226]KIX96130.1 hypothetical protein Z520_08385 [Fonsecaea multimorphosa CBS 102226]
MSSSIAMTPAIHTVIESIAVIMLGRPPRDNQEAIEVASSQLEDFLAATPSMPNGQLVVPKATQQQQRHQQWWPPPAAARAAARAAAAAVMATAEAIAEEEAEEIKEGDDNDEDDVPAAAATSPLFLVECLHPPETSTSMTPRQIWAGRTGINGLVDHAKIPTSGQENNMASQCANSTPDGLNMRPNTRKTGGPKTRGAWPRETRRKETRRGRRGRRQGQEEGQEGGRESLEG